MKTISIRKSTQIFILAMVFIFSMKFFQSTPFERLFFQLQAVFLGLILLFLISYVVSTLIKEKKFNKVVLYYLLLIAIVPIYGAFVAMQTFGQPFIYGFLSERGWLLFGVGIWFYYVLVTKKISFETMESAFVFMAWASLIIFSLFVLTFDQSQIQSYQDATEGVSSLVNMTEGRGLRFKFQTYFITFGVIYYFVKYSFRKNPINLIFLFIFLGYIIFVVQGRTYMMTLAVTMLLYYWFNYSLSKFTLIIIKLLLFMLAALVVIQTIMPDYLERMGDLFLQMFTVLTGEESRDASANARIFQSLIVFEYFNAHPLSIWLGTGKVSHQWNDGYDSIFGYFYPSDIGVLGGLFVYGIIGFIFLWLVPFVISMKIIKKATDKHDIFVTTLKYLLVYALVGSIQGSLYFGYVGYSIPMFILLAYLKMWDKKNFFNTDDLNNHLTQNIRNK